MLKASFLPSSANTSDKRVTSTMMMKGLFTKAIEASVRLADNETVIGREGPLGLLLRLSNTSCFR